MALEYKELDVRPLLQAGVEPFVEIMTAVDNLGSGQGLRLLAPFKPQPLFSVMEYWPPRMRSTPTTGRSRPSNWISPIWIRLNRW